MKKKTKKEKNNIWNNTIPVERSAYLQENQIKFFNEDTFFLDKEKPTMIDLFCGAGGFSVGCEWAGFQSVFGVDYLEPAMRTWVRNHPHSIACLGDIRELPPELIKKKLSERGVSRINLITGGVPCQGFSRANRKHNDNDERNFLFLEYMKYVKVFDPDYIILENVSGMRSTAGGKFENDIKTAMQSLGYNTTVKLVNAAEFGVPQLRQRLIFVGVNKKLGVNHSYQFPIGKFKNNYRTVEDAISDLPALKNAEHICQYAYSPKTDYQKLMRGEGNISEIKKPVNLMNHVAPNHPRETIKKIKDTLPGKPMYVSFKQRIRLKMDVPSPTQLAGGIRPQFQFGHPQQPRGLTIRERARIQSFPDSYIFEGGIVQERVQTGNAVPPLLIYNLVEPIAQDIKKGEKKNV